MPEVTSKAPAPNATAQKEEGGSWSLKGTLSGVSTKIARTANAILGDPAPCAMELDLPLVTEPGLYSYIGKVGKGKAACVMDLMRTNDPKGRPLVITYAVENVESGTFSPRLQHKITPQGYLMTLNPYNPDHSVPIVIMTSSLGRSVVEKLHQLASEEYNRNLSNPGLNMPEFRTRDKVAEACRAYGLKCRFPF